MGDKYWLAGQFYEMMTSHAVNRCRIAMLDQLQPGDKVLFAGVGHGVDAIYAAQRGAQVTAVDLSTKMLRKFRQNLDQIPQGNNTSLNIHLIHADLLKVTEYEQYDMVVANFFLNVFYRKTMRAMLEQLIKLGKPGAKVVIGDFASPNGDIVSRAFQTLFWLSVATSFCLLAGNAIHSVYNYPEEMRLFGLLVKDQKYFKFWQMTCYCVTLGQKPA